MSFELNLACQKGELEKVKFLVESKADITAGDNIAVQIASGNGHLETVKFLIKHKADITAGDNWAIGLASMDGHLETVKFLVTGDLAVRGEPPRGNFEPGNKAGITANNHAIWWASVNGHLEIVKFLIENKANVNADDIGPISGASKNGHLEIVKCLVENKADITANDNHAIQWATRRGHLEIVKFLLSKGADFKKLTPEHKTYFRTLKWFRRWRKIIFLRRLKQIALPIYYSPGFPGSFKERKSLETFLTSI